MMTTSSLPGALRHCSLAITAEAIRAYAELTDDFNPLHLDEEFAAQTPMGRVIAHGTLSLCLIWQCVHRSFDPGVFNTLKLDVRFVKPVFIGDVLSAGGQPRADAPQCWDVWVRGADGADRVVGELRLDAPSRSQTGDLT